MECRIKVKGDGAGRYGNPKADKEGPVSDFLVDNSVYYTAIRKHIRDCGTCDPAEFLQTYLRRRIQIPKFKGQTSSGLVDNALQYEKIASKKGVTLPGGLVNAFIWRAGVSYIAEHRARLSVREAFQGFRLLADRAPFGIEKLSSQDRYLLELSRQGVGGDLSEAELEELVKVAEVMLS